VATLGATQTLTAKTLTSPIINAATVGTSFTPTTSDGAALGSASLMFSDLFLASGAVINWNNGDVSLTHSANRLDFAGATVYTMDGDLYLSAPFHTFNNIATTAGGHTSAGVTFGSANVGIYWGSGAPTITGVQGSLYIRTDGGANTRLYSNTNGSTGWAAITSA
jgi:hypothetical protein